MNAVELTYARLNTEEGRRAFAYNDATGKQVTCKPGGNLTIAVGVNLEEGLDQDEIDWLSRHRLTKLESQLQKYVWYQSLTDDEPRKSVLLDIAFNEGLGGLLHFPHMLGYIQYKNWPLAASNCTVEDPKLKKRYAALAQILLAGNA